MIKKVFAIALMLIALCACEKEPDDQIVPVASVTMSQPEAEMQVGEILQLKAQISPSNATEQNVVWASSKQSVATVSDAGKVTAVGEGSANITASVDGKSASCAITVTKPEVPVVHVESVTLDKTDATLEIGQSLTLTATVLPDNAYDKSVVWKSTNPEIAEVDQNGKVTAMGTGTATITATTADGGKVAGCEVVVKEAYVPVESVTIMLDDDVINYLNAQKGEEGNLYALVLPENASQKTVTWTSSNTDVVTVDQTGAVVCVGGGEAVLTAEAGGKTAECQVTVTVSVKYITLNFTELEMTVGETFTLVATVYPDDATNKNVRWASYNTDVVLVEDGVLTALAIGKARVEAYIGLKRTSCFVTVKEPFIEDQYDGETDGHKWVDLGLPSGIKWATCNVGADNSSQHGFRFAWGEITPNEDNSAPYKWYDPGTGKYLKYVTDSEFGVVDNLTTLEAADDAATANWGGDWRMPTFEDFIELSENTTYEYIEQNGEYGGKFTSKNNSHSIFLSLGADYSGEYLSSTLYELCNNQFRSVRIDFMGYYSGVPDRGIRRSVRPVIDNH